MHPFSPTSGIGVKARLKRTFRSLDRHNYRVWAAGSFVSNIGTWMQRIAQDWLAGFSPRWALGVGAASGFVATIVAFAYHRYRIGKVRTQR